jgi:hypothetical protein
VPKWKTISELVQSDGKQSSIEKYSEKLLELEKIEYGSVSANLDNGYSII